VRNSKKTWLLALLLALVPCVAGAAGLGRLNVLSALGQPLVGEIELVSATREELGSLSARIASADAYQQANLQYNPALVGARVTVERRPGGQHFLKITSTRPVTEPFIDVLIELTWASGRLSREYTALLDPPGIAPTPAPTIAAAPESRPAPARRETPAAAPSRPVTPAAPSAGAKEYGPVKSGETLAQIAKEVKPEGVTLEQMVVALYRNNPDAFIRKNLNLVRTGKILRVPEREEVASVSSGEAATEFRTHVTDWNSYRQKTADAADTVPVEGRTTAGGKITAKVEDQGKGGQPKDVVRLSKSETAGAPKGKPGNTAERIRALEEEVVARDKALSEANERIQQLEKTIKDMQKLVELKSPGMAAAQQQAQQQAAAPKPEAKSAAKSEQPKSEAKKPDVPAPATKPEAAKPAEAPKPDTGADKPVAEQPEAKKAEQPAPSAPKPPSADKPKAKPAPKSKEPELMDQVMDAVTDPLYLGVAGGVVVLGGLAFWLARRRRQPAGDDEPQIAPRLGKTDETGAGAAAAASAQDAVAAQAAAGEDVDPLAEAEVYIAYGRDGQAEEILKEALAKDPKREDVQLKLLEIYSARKDKASFAKLAEGLHKQTGGTGDNWIKAAAMGYALDSGNSLYAAGKDAVASVGGAGAATDIDLDLGLGDTGTATDITLDAGAAGAAAGIDTGILDLGAGEPAAEQAAATPDFSLEVPAAGGTQTDIALETAPAPEQDAGMLDFQIELPKAGEEPATQAAPPAAAPAASGDAGLDFKLDDLNLNLDQPKTEVAAAGEKDGHWYDVQTKFDLAKAYQEMGDKDGAKEILQEVMKEGDAEQKAQAKTLMDSLG
jgi:pilus assembly protein FimV